jgi:hypothetical protein
MVCLCWGEESWLAWQSWNGENWPCCGDALPIRAWWLKLHVQVGAEYQEEALACDEWLCSIRIVTESSSQLTISLTKARKSRARLVDLNYRYQQQEHHPLRSEGPWGSSCTEVGHPFFQEGAPSGKTIICISDELHA